MKTQRTEDRGQRSAKPAAGRPLYRPTKKTSLRVAKPQRDKLVSYIRLRRKTAAAHRAAEALKEEVFSIVSLAGGRFIALNAMIFIGQNVSYQYPEEIKKSGADLETLKKIAQLSGAAQKVVKDVLQFSDLQKKTVPDNR